MMNYSAIDHLVIAGPDLSAISKTWRRSTGVAPTPGGAHTGRGTRNELVGIAESTYVELIGPDVDQPNPPSPRPFGIDDLVGPRLVTFAVAVPNLELACDAVGATGINPGEILSMQRKRPDGVQLSWRLALPPDPDLAGVMPFMIEWAPSTPHPASDLGPEMSIASLSFSHPDAPSIASAVYAATGWEMPVEVGPPLLAVTLRSRNGEISF